MTKPQTYIDAIKKIYKGKTRLIRQKMNKRSIINDAMNYLRDIPQMQNILNNLPDGLHIVFSTNINDNKAAYSPGTNRIMINIKKLDYDTPQGKMNFLTVFAHELCHANQKKSGLNIDDIITPSDGQTFRISKMAEMETWLLEITLEQELIKLPEFEKCAVYDGYLVYKYMLTKASFYEKLAKRDFVLAHWKNIFNNDEININNHIFSNLTELWKLPAKRLQKLFYHSINWWNDTYIEQACHDLLVMRTLKTSTNRTTPIQAIQTYLERMGISGIIDPALFLQERFDNIEVSPNLSDGVIVYNADGTKSKKYIPTTKQVNVIHFEKNNRLNSNSMTYAGR